MTGATLVKPAEPADASVALPTHADFTIDASELNRRLRDASGSRLVSELELLVELPRALRKSAALQHVREGRPPRWAGEVATFQHYNW